MLNNELLKIETLVEILLYSEENRTEYLINKRRISNILYYLSKDKHSKFFKLNDVSDLKSEFENLAISLEAQDGEHEKYKTNIFNKILVTISVLASGADDYDCKDFNEIIAKFYPF